MEIVNIGPVWLKGGVWRDYVGKVWAEKDIVKGQYRGADGAVMFPDDQIEAVCDLANWLFDKFKIPRLVPKQKMAFLLSKLTDFKGAISHEMVRGDKFDMGIAFPWDVVIEKCKLKEVDL